MRIMAFCIGVPNLKFLASAVTRYEVGPNILKVGYVLPARPPLT